MPSKKFLGPASRHSRKFLFDGLSVLQNVLQSAALAPTDKIVIKRAFAYFVFDDPPLLLADRFNL
jgi:hypothetical protein